MTTITSPEGSVQPVILWGFSKRDFSYFFDYFVRVNLDPRALVAPTEADVAPILPVLTPEQLGAEGLRHIPVVLAPGLGFVGIEECREQLAAHGALDGRRIVHACCALNELGYDLAGRILCVGFPGSGNVMLQSMIYRLMEQMPNPYPGIMPTPQLGFLVPDHQAVWTDFIRTRLQLPENSAVVFVPETENSISMRVNCADGRCFDLYGIANPHWHTARLLTSHVLPEVDFSRRWIARGGKFVVQMRNPLDTIVSCAAKQIRPPSRILGDLDWFRRMARLLARYLQQVQELPEGKVILRYEDILDAPLTYGLRIAHVLESNSDVEHLGQIWEQIGFKELVGQQAFNRTQKHFFRPGAGKWREYLDSQHARIAEEEGLAAQMAAFGYVFDRDQFAPVRDISSLPPISADEMTMMLGGDWPYYLFDAPDYFSSSGAIQGKLLRSHMRFFTNDKGFADTLRLLDAETLPLYCASGSPL